MTNLINAFLSPLKAGLLMAALAAGLTAAADTPISYGGQTYTLFDSEGYYTATAGSPTPTVYTYDYLVDNVVVPPLYGLPYTYTYWMTEDENGFETKFIEFYSADPIVLKGYRLRTACNTEAHPNRRPRSWTLKGKKHADDEWTELATVSGDNQLPAGNEKTADYWLTSNTAPYQYFRFEVTAIHGSEEIKVSKNVSYNRSRMELSDLQIIGDKYSANTDLDYATIEGLKHYYKYDNGNDITPSFTVKDMSGNTLTENTDYTVSYSHDGNSVTTVNATGTYTLTITGTGSYTGKKTASFKVYKALDGDGSEAQPYIIADANDWYIFGQYIKEDGTDYYEKCYKLADKFDNSNEPITEMIATDDSKPFGGTLDGNGRTLHIALKANSEAGCAPFRYLKDATIKNLTIAGYAATSSKFGASIAVENLENGSTNITDCYSRVNIASSINDNGNAADGTHGGFVAVNRGELTFTRCAFLGSMFGSTAKRNGGFVGWHDGYAGTLTFRQCVFDPVWVSMSETNSKTFSRHDNNYPEFDISAPSYFTYAGWGTDQGTQAVALTTAPANLGNVVSNEGTMTLYQNALLCGGKYYVTNLSLYDNASNATLLRDTDGKRINVTLSGRTLFKDGKWNTLCLPFDLSSAEVGDNLNGGTLMKLDTEGTYDANGNDDADGAYKTGFDPATGTLRLYFKTAEEIKAGTPYIIKWPSGGGNIENREFQNVKIDNSDEALIRQTVESADKRVQFIGTFSPVAIYSADHDNFYLGGDNKLHRPQTYDYAINAFRAYFHIDFSGGSNIRAMDLYFDDDTQTGISHTETTEKAGAWYDLQGRRLAGKPTTRSAEGRLFPQGLKKGVYIVNGSKLVIK